MPAHNTSQSRFLTRLVQYCTALLCVTGTPFSSAENFTPGPQALGAIEQQYGQLARLRVEDWQYLIQSGAGLSNVEKLRQVNAFINRVEFVNDIDHWGVEDYWATPLQLLTSNGGDCEDFSIAKYFTLRQMGIPADRLRLTYVKALKLNQAHMVLTYFQTPNADPLVLDNLVAEIQTSSNRNDLQPVYSFNAEGLWLSRTRGNEQHLGKPERLSRWKEVVARISMEQMLPDGLLARR